MLGKKWALKLLFTVELNSMYVTGDYHMSYKLEKIHKLKCIFIHLVPDNRFENYYTDESWIEKLFEREVCIKLSY